MSKKKKKHNQQRNDKIAKAHHRNVFFQKIHSICKLVSDEEVYRLIPENELDITYRVRVYSMKIVPAEGNHIDSRLLKEAIMVLSELTKIAKTQITEDGIEISLADYYTVGISFYTYLKRVQQSDFPNSKEIVERMKKFIDYEEAYNKAFGVLHGLLQTIGLFSSDLSKQLYWLKHTIVQVTDGNVGMQNMIFVHAHKPEQKQVTIDGNTRPVTRICWAFANVGVEYAFIKHEDIGIKKGFLKFKPMEVYIQSHALQRLAERIDSLIVGIVGINLYVSIKEIKAIRYKNDNLLIEFRILNIKAGYLLADVVGNMVVIRTFLFLTNSGTPEGDKLDEICGLKKMDKEYLAIGKLSSFMSSDIRSNKEVEKVFQQAGCDCLFQLYDEIKGFATKESQQSTAELMAKFLGFNN